MYIVCSFWNHLMLLNFATLTAKFIYLTFEKKLLPGSNCHIQITHVVGFLGEMRCLLSLYHIQIKILTR